MFWAPRRQADHHRPSRKYLLDSTLRFAVGLRYEVALGMDAIAAFSWEEKGTVEIDDPSYASPSPIRSFVFR
jgi:hypothetical protein